MFSFLQHVMAAHQKKKIAEERKRQNLQNDTVASQGQWGRALVREADVPN